MRTALGSSLFFFVLAACDGASTSDAEGGAGGHGAGGSDGQGAGIVGGSDGHGGGAPLVCEPDTCNGHGVCTDSDAGASCACDEGFTGVVCDETSADFYSRSLVMPGLADPDVYKENDDQFFLSGTLTGNSLPIYSSTDLRAFDLAADYAPSAVDPSFDYCYLWAPDLSKHEGIYHLYFSAHRVSKGAACPPGSGQDVTTFHTTATDTTFAFGPPELVNDGTTFPRSRIASGCPGDGCSQVIRIDSALVDDGADQWLFYVWFQGGNNVSSFRSSDPGTVVHNAGPARFGGDLASYEEAINEAPEVLHRGDKYYLFFSTGWYDSQYAMRYIMADSVADLTRARTVRRHSQAVRTGAGFLTESRGHNSIVERRGQYFNFFHVGEFGGGGQFQGRSTWKQRLSFAPDGSLRTLNVADVAWSKLDGYDYSLDVVTRDGQTVGPCVATGILGSSTSHEYTGICPSAADLIVHKSDIAAFRVYYSNDGTWTQSAEQPYDGVSDHVFVPIEGGFTSRVTLGWNEKVTGTRYSLDVQRADGTWVAPCAGVGALGKSLAYSFSGSCPTANSSVPVPEVKAFRICSAVNDDWANAVCGEASYDGAAGHVDISVP
ncbi:MAG: family 43 glycosylhydrolase [Polyangiaceae bacterium]|nr:family 43 glycosylhydrolase [Polyangiaceae bacterium]